MDEASHLSWRKACMELVLFLFTLFCGESKDCCSFLLLFSQQAVSERSRMEVRPLFTKGAGIWGLHAPGVLHFIYWKVA